MNGGQRYTRRPFWTASPHQSIWKDTGMAIQQNQKRIRTTHIGSLPRPHTVLDLLKPKLNGQPYDQKVLDATVAQAVARPGKEAGRMRHR